MQLLLEASTSDELMQAVERASEDAVIAEHPCPLLRFCRKKVESLQHSQERTTAEVVLLSKVASLHLDRLWGLQDGIRQARDHGASHSLTQMISNLL